MGQDTVSIILSVISLILSSALAIFALVQNVRDSSANKKENDFRARQQYDAEVRKWAGDCTHALSDGVYIIASGLSDERMLYQTISAISALLEQGRLFFPNNPQSARNHQSDAPAHQGVRPRILDWLVWSLRVCAVTKPPYDREAEEVLQKLQAGFTSDVQCVLNPREPFGTMTELAELLLHGEFMDSSQSHPDIAGAKAFIVRRKALDL